MVRKTIFFVVKRCMCGGRYPSIKSLSACSSSRFVALATTRSSTYTTMVTPFSRRWSLLPSETSSSGTTALSCKRPSSPLLDAIVLSSVWRGSLSLDFALAQEGLKLAVELASAPRAYDVNLEALKSNVFVDYAVQRHRGLIPLPKEMGDIVLVQSPTESMANILPPRDVSWKGLESSINNLPGCLSARLSVNFCTAYHRTQSKNSVGMGSRSD